MQEKTVSLIMQSDLRYRLFFWDILIKREKREKKIVKHILKPGIFSGSNGDVFNMGRPGNTT